MLRVSILDSNHFVRIYSSSSSFLPRKRVATFLRREEESSRE